MNRQQLRSFFANLLKERTQKLLKNNERNKNNSVILTVKNKKLPTTKKNKIFSDWDPKTSRIVCQFFIFGTLFGVVCSISACTCLLQPKNNNRQQVMPRLSIAPPTLDDTKPIRIQFGDDGFCYARSLEESEVPPLPDYNSALSLPTNVISSLQSQMIEIGLIEDKKVNNYI
uniref:Uncharacterized protein n=1 Tax=Parastrongyloides trichosuri TaxID=131310 RepID=A0A0N4ZJB1_PARTI